MKSHTTKLERRTQAYLRTVCRDVRKALSTKWESKQLFCTTLDMYRRMVEQVWLATHCELNILGTGEEYNHNPVHARRGADECVLHFLYTAGDKFALEFNRGVW